MISASKCIEYVNNVRKLILSENQLNMLHGEFWQDLMSKNIHSDTNIATDNAVISNITTNDITDNKNNNVIVNSSVHTAKTSATTDTTTATNITNSTQVNSYKKIAKAINMPPLLLCVGLPASGKTTFSKLLVKNDPNFFVRINKDEMDFYK